MKFDVIAGNPPYQGSGRKKIYINFLKTSLNTLTDGGSLVFITPGLSINFLLGEEILQQKIDKMYDIEYISYSNDIKTAFTNIGSDFVIFKVNKKTYSGKTTVFHSDNSQSIHSYKFKNNIVCKDNKFQSIVDKTMTLHGNKWDRYASRISDNLIDTPKPGYNTKIVYKINTNSVEYMWTNKYHKNINSYKVLYPTLGNQFIIDVDKNMYPGTSFVPYVKFNSISECNNFVSLFDTNLYKFLLKVFCDMRSPLDYVIKNGKKIPLNKKYTNYEMYKLFNLTDEEIKIVENYK